MRLLVISDAADPALWDYYVPGRLDGVDAILSCGDLPAEYLSFLVTMSSVPLFYVHGNHDDRYDRTPPEGCVDIDGRVIQFRGYRILGLGGSMRYNDRGKYQYTEREMAKRIARLWLPLRRGVDLLATHAPAMGEEDGMADLCHRGFACFAELIRRCRPLYHFYGHIHLQYVPTRPRTRQLGDTTAVNASGKYIVDLPDRPGGKTRY